MSDGLQQGFSANTQNDIISNESCKYDSKINGLIFPKQAKMIANYVLWALSQSIYRTVTYGEVSDQCERRYKEYIKPSDSNGKENNKTGRIALGSVGNFSDDINAFSAKYGLPFITGKIVTKEEKLPQNGFFKSLSEYYPIYKYNIPDNISSLTHAGRQRIVDDVDRNIEKDFNKILDTFKLLNHKDYFISNNENIDNNVTEDTIDTNKLIEEIDSQYIKETDKMAYTKVRIGQSELRSKKLQETGCCEICGLDTKELLIASHIKPWAVSDNYEKLDNENILLLCVTHDALFDKGFISFDQKGNIIISKELTDEEQALLNIHDESKIDITSNRKINYLKYHRENIFRK